MSGIWICNVCKTKVPAIEQGKDSIWPIQSLNNDNARKVIENVGSLVIAGTNEEEKKIQEKVKRGMTEEDAIKEFFIETKRILGLCPKCFPD